MSRWLEIILIAIISTSMMTTSTASDPQRPFIIDTDIGVDDAIAILYLLKSPTIDVKAITVVGTGNAHCTPGVDNTKKLLTLLDKQHIPVVCGRSKPLGGDNHFPPAVLTESDTLGGTNKLLPVAGKRDLSASTAPNLLIQTLLKSSRPISILAIGPLTNIAEALQQQPTIKKHIKAIYIMGGAIHAPGNIEIVDPAAQNKFAEWNIYLDPLAAQIVFRSGIKLILIPLDITNQLPIDMNFYNQLHMRHQSPGANYVFTLLKSNLPMLQAKEWYFWDPLAAVIADKPSIASYQAMPLDIILQPPAQNGRVVVSTDNHHPQVLVATAIKADKFKQELIDTLNR